MPAKTPFAVWLLLLSLYTTQYLGLGFLLTGLVAILRKSGASLETLGIVYLIGFAWPLKVLWAPLIDRFGVGRLGHYRGWLIITQSGLVLSLALLSQLHPLQDIGLVLAMAAVVSFLSASQDTAVSGLLCLILPPADRGPAKGLHNAGHLLGILIGGGLLLMLYEYWGWANSMWMLAAGTAVTLLQLLLYREPDEVSRAPRGMRLSALVQPFRGEGGGAWLLLLLVLPINISMAYALMAPLLIDAGWSLHGLGVLVNILGPGAGIGAALVTGRLLNRYRRRTMLIATVALQIPCALGLLLPLFQWGGDAASAMGIALIYLLYQPSQIAAMTVMMDRSGLEQPAAAFTMQNSLHMLSGMAAMSVGAPLAAAIGYAGVIVAAAVAGTVALAVALLFRSPEPASVPPLAP